MGNDGGSIPTRRELVKEAARNKTTTELKETQAEQQEYFWTTDPITNEPLEPPIVADCNGKLYKKESVLKLLTADESINKEEAEKATAGAVKTLKDVVEVKFTADTGASENGEKAMNGTKANKWICPITNKPLGPGSKAVYIVPCGHAFSGAAIKEVADDKCLVCSETYAPNDVIPIVPTSAEDLARLALRMKTLKEKGLTHSLKKGKKRKAKDLDDASEQAPALVPAKQKNGDGGTSTPTNGIKNSATASLAAKVAEEQERKKRKMGANDNLKALFKDRDQKVDMKNSGDFMTRGFTVGK